MATDFMALVLAPVETYDMPGDTTSTGYIQEGTKLVVEFETADHAWYNVVTESGASAWIPANNTTPKDIALKNRFKIGVDFRYIIV